MLEIMQHIYDSKTTTETNSPCSAAQAIAITSPVPQTPTSCLPRSCLRDLYPQIRCTALSFFCPILPYGLRLLHSTS